MATYKKRGYKPKTKVDKVKAEEEKSTTAGVFNTLDEGASKTEEWVVKNQKYIFGFVGLVAIIILGYLAYDRYIKAPKEIEATNEMFQAQQYFDQALNGTKKDSLYTLALQGGNGKFGMVDIVNEYKGTKAANLANYYAGMAYLHLKDYQNAITHLSDFSSDDNILGPMALGAIGDAFVQLEQPQDALEYYEKAANKKTNNYTTPMFLYKTGIIALDEDLNDKALVLFNRIKNEFPESTEANTIDIFIGKAEAKIN